MPNVPWKRSYEVSLYDTASGWLEAGQFALTEDGAGFVVQDPNGVLVPGFGTMFAPLTTDTTGLTQVHIIGRQWFHEFVLPNGKTLQINTNQAAYQALASKKPTNPTQILTQSEIDAFSPPGVINLNLPPHGDSF